jgi:hypothetical protein
VASAQCLAAGDEAAFVGLADGRRVHLGGDANAVDCAADALQGEIDPPYRALAVRREGDTWAVGAISIEVVELPADTEGEELMLTVTQEGERALEVDGRSTIEGIEPLEQVVGGRHDAYVLRAERLDERLWEIGIDPL